MRQHLIFWILLLLGGPLVVMVLFSPQKLTQFITSDYQIAVTILGDANKEIFNNNILKLYQRHLELLDLQDTKTSHSNQISDPFVNSELSIKFFTNLKLEAYHAALRLAYIKSMWYWLIPSLLAGFISGYFERRLKKDTFSSPVPPIFNTSTHMLLLISCLLILWIICPIPIALKVIPTLLVLVSYFVSLAITHYPNY